ncbi:MAG: cation transporter [Tenericutes bacterium]|nr:cation transporter [Mycoplasmatota bacterium]
MKTEKRMLITFILNFLFTIIEFIGGIITNSVALLSDSIHDLGDSISIGIAIFLEKKSRKKPDKDYTYGYLRFSMLGALISSIILLIGSGYIIFEAVNRILKPELINTELIIYFSIFGVIVNGIAALNISKGKSLNEKAITLHMLEDVLGWVALLIASLVMHFTDILILDAILSLAFSVFIIYHVVKNLSSIFKVLLEGSPSHINIEEIKSKLLKINKVKDIHHLHIWSLTDRYEAVTLHAIIMDNLKPKEITEIQNNIINELQNNGIKHSTIQVEFESNQCIDSECENVEEPNIEHKH